jgi:hypothetical protein
VAAITERVARTTYAIHADGTVIGRTQKAASTLIYAHVKHLRRCGIAEAAAARDLGYDVILVVRHPLDRLVSNYVFWCAENREGFQGIMGRDNGPGDDQPVKVPAVELLKDLTIEEFQALIDQKYDPHWVDQSVYHSYEGKLVPNVLLPWEVLPTLRTSVVNPSLREGTWEDYYTPEFRLAMEERYLSDIAMHVMATETWDGKRPKAL